MTEVLDTVRGDASGLQIPAHPDALQMAGADFLTRAFRAFGILDATNRVTDFKLEVCDGGSTGRKALLWVDYLSPTGGLDTELFVKFSRDFTDPIRDRKCREMEPEVNLGKISRHPAFPIAVAQTYFADFHAASGTGILITQRIAFGEGPIAPQQSKSFDHKLPNALEHYEAIFTALGRLVAAHKSGRLSPDLELAFPFDLNVAIAEVAIPYDAAKLGEQLGRVEGFAALAPQLFPNIALTPDFFERLRDYAAQVLEHEHSIKRFLHIDPDYVALCHWNANIDNAWFWRDERRKLQCGLIDWGGVRQLNLAYAIWGALLVTSDEIWDHDLDHLLALFVDEIAAGGGPGLSQDTLALHLDLYVGLIGMAAVIVAPDIILHRMPGVVRASGPFDPLFEKNEQARNFLRVLTNFFRLWEKRDLPGRLKEMLARTNQSETRR